MALGLSLGSAVDFLGGGVVTFIFFFIAALVLFGLFKMLRFFTRGSRMTGGMFKKIVRLGSDAWSRSRRETERVRKEAASERQVAARVQEERKNVQQAEQILTDPKASTQTKANALRSLFASLRRSFEIDRDSFQECISSINKDKRDARGILHDTKKMLAKQKDLLKQIIREAREMQRLGGRDVSIGNLVGLLQSVEKIDEQIIAFENIERKEYIPRLGNIAKERRKIEKTALEILKQAEKVLDIGEFTPENIASILAYIAQVDEKIDFVFALSSEAVKIGRERWQNLQHVLPNEATIAQYEQRVGKAVQTHEAMKLEIERKTKAA